MEWPAQRCYVGLVAAGVQEHLEQAEDILVPTLLRNRLTLMTFPFPSHYLPSRTVVLAIVQWRGERYDGTSTRTGPLQSKKIKNRIER